MDPLDPDPDPQHCYKSETILQIKDTVGQLIAEQIVINLRVCGQKQTLCAENTGKQ